MPSMRKGRSTLKPNGTVAGSGGGNPQVTLIHDLRDAVEQCSSMRAVADSPHDAGGSPSGDPRAGCPRGLGADSLDVVTDKRVKLDLDEFGLSADLPRPESPADEVQQVPYRPVQFRDDDLPTALARSAAWLRRAQQWLGEPLDVIAIHLDYDDRAGSPYYEVKLLCNEEDLAGAPLAIRRAAQSGDH
jgi:hypothetical protein